MIHGAAPNRQTETGEEEKSSPPLDYPKHLSYDFKLGLKWLHGTNPYISITV